MAGSILVITNLNEPNLDNGVTDKVVDLWHIHGATEVQAYQLPVDLHLGHDLVGLQQPDQSAAAVISAGIYPKLLELIDK